jgi:site-specific DNA-methyltransferase (adenine-specific)
MDISTSVITGDISENTVWSWLDISDAILSETSRFTIETVTRLTTALRTLSFSLRENTSSDTGSFSPNWEPICLARKPLDGTVANCVLKHGTGAINIDGCRIGTEVETWPKSRSYAPGQIQPGGKGETMATGPMPAGRWPANLCHDGSDEVLAGFPDQESGANPTRRASGMGYHGAAGQDDCFAPRGAESGSASRFFYCAKTTTEERGEGNNHPTVKPQALMRWLVRLVTPKGGTVLDPFMGSGSTGLAADAEQFDFIGCEMSSEYAAIAEARLTKAGGLFASVEVIPHPSSEAA